MLNKKIIVLMLGHRALSGKDTFYSFSRDFLFMRVAFADKLKQIASDLYSLTEEQVYGSLKDIEDYRYKNFIDSKTITIHDGDSYIEIPNPIYKEYLTPRRILQIIGQQQREINPTVWPEYVFNNKIPELINNGFNKFIITDFRFKNEAEVAKKWKHASKFDIDLKFIKINRNLSISQSDDISEHDLDNFDQWDHIIDNNDSLIEFQTKTNNLLNTIMR